MNPKTNHNCGDIEIDILVVRKRETQRETLRTVQQEFEEVNRAAETAGANIKLQYLVDGGLRGSNFLSLTPLGPEALDYLRDHATDKAQRAWMTRHKAVSHGPTPYDNLLETDTWETYMTRQRHAHAFALVRNGKWLAQDEEPNPLDWPRRCAQLLQDIPLDHEVVLMRGLHYSNVWNTKPFVKETMPTNQVSWHVFTNSSNVTAKTSRNSGKTISKEELAKAFGAPANLHQSLEKVRIDLNAALHDLTDSEMRRTLRLPALQSPALTFEKVRIYPRGAKNPWTQEAEVREPDEQESTQLDADELRKDDE
jgi:hypothetical protein